MNSFKIGKTEFGIGKISLSIENDLLTLEINGNDDVFDELMEDDGCEWSWALYPPRIYFRSDQPALRDSGHLEPLCPP